MSEQSITAALRERVFATARYRCGYCLSAQLIIGPVLQIEHILPSSRGGTSTEDNLWVACPNCNRHKSDRVAFTDPETSALAPLFNPRVDRWNEHFVWVANGTLIQGRTAIGRATVAALHLNDSRLVASRQVWVAVGLHPPTD